MHAAVVGAAAERQVGILAHVRRLADAAERVARVVPAAGVRVLQAAQVGRREGRRLDDLLAHRPAPTVDERAEDIGVRFVERARLALVDQIGGAVDDAVGELVADDIQPVGERLEDAPPSP